MKVVHPHPLGFALALAAAFWAASPAAGQKPERASEHPHSRFDVDFPGGTVSEYVAALRRARPDGAANIVVMPGAEKLHVPPIKLVGVTVEAAMRILDGPYNTEDGLLASIDVHSYEIGDSPDLVIKILAKFVRPGIRSAVWSVQEALTYGQTAEDLLAAVEAARQLFPTKAEISYHPPTGLLIARGAEEQLNLVREVLKQLIAGAERRAMDLESLRRKIDDLEADRNRIEAEMNIAQKEATVCKVFLEQAQKAMERGESSREDVAQAELEITRAEMEVVMKEQECRRTDAWLESLRDAVKRYDTKRE